MILLITNIDICWVILLIDIQILDVIIVAHGGMVGLVVLFMLNGVFSRKESM